MDLVIGGVLSVAVIYLTGYLHGQKQGQREAGKEHKAVKARLDDVMKSNNRVRRVK